MRAQYKVLAEKYTSVVKENMFKDYDKYEAIKKNIPNHISRLKNADSIGDFYDIVGEINADFDAIVELFGSKVPGRIITSDQARMKYEAAWDYRTELMNREITRQIGTLPAPGSKDFYLKPSRENSGPLSFYKALEAALQMHATNYNNTSEAWKELNKDFIITFGSWQHHKKVAQQMKKGSEEAGVNLDI